MRRQGLRILLVLAHAIGASLVGALTGKSSSQPMHFGRVVGFLILWRNRLGGARIGERADRFRHSRLQVFTTSMLLGWNQQRAVLRGHDEPMPGSVS